MKKNHKIKSLLTLLLTAIIVITSLISTNAENKSIQLGKATQIKGYIAGVSFADKITEKGYPLYCLNMHKKTATNIKANLVSNSKYIDGGVLYILENGYPVKKITGNRDKDYYITQTAVWWYLDKVKGTQNLGEQFKKYGSDSYDMRKYVKDLVNKAYKHRNDSTTSTNASLNITSSNDTMVLNGNYYVSSDIKASTISGIDSYNITIDNPIEGTKIVVNGIEYNYKDGFTIKANDSFKVSIPAESIDATKAEIKLTAIKTGINEYHAYEYQPVDSNMQNVALLEKTTTGVSSNLTLNITSSKITVHKIDENTKKDIAGAKLVLKDSTGKELSSWTSTTNGYVIRNLPNGTYTIEETEAPTGYILNTNITTFTINDAKKDFKINIENAPKKVVVNITKIDQATNQPLAGATIVVKDSTGKEVARFVTTSETYVLTDLSNGTYTVEEESAPAGYMKSNEKISFTIDDTHLSHQITLINAKETIVPDTASVSSIIMLILGIVIIGVGIRFVYKNRQRI